MKNTASSSEEKPVKENLSFDLRRRLRVLATPLQFIKGIGPKRAAQLDAFGLKTVEDLLYHLPFRYDDRRQIDKIAGASPGQEASFIGRLIALQNRYIPRRRSQMLLGALQDDSASIDLIWFRAPKFLVDGLIKGQLLLVHGKVETGLHGRLRLSHPDFEIIDGETDTGLQRILPVYVHPAGVSLTLLRQWVAQALREYRDHVADCLPPEVIRRQGLMPAPAALTLLHEPPPEAAIATLNDFSSAAHRTMIFDELFYLQLGLGVRKRAARQ